MAVTSMTRNSSQRCRSARACTACSAPTASCCTSARRAACKDRVGTYFLASNVDPKVQALVQQIARIEVTVTNSETEALLLEYNLIKAAQAALQRRAAR